MDRIELCNEKFTELFGEVDNSTPGTDQEFMDILQRFIFGEVFYVGELDDKLRELITVVVLTVNQTLPQLSAHTNAALNIGVKPIEIKEAIYLCAPLIGFPKSLNAINIVNEVFKSRNIQLPLESQKTVEENNRYEKGKEIQFPLYGDAIKERMKDLPSNFGEVIPRFLTEVCFGDFYTRSGLDLKTRELLVLCMLASLGDTEKQIISHSKGNIKAGNSKETMIAAMIHCIPYMGFPRVFNAINTIKEVNYK
ncbi:MAG: carboxymuconolactone decarboxylase family protein [Peptostreptococcaceae bacterium]